MLPSEEDLLATLEAAEPQTAFLFIDSESRFDARVLEPLATLGKEAVVPVDLDSHGYQFTEYAVRYFEKSFENVRQANPIGALLISADVLRELLARVEGFTRRISDDNLPFAAVLDLVIDAGVAVDVSDIFPIKATRTISDRSFQLRRASRANDGLFSTLAVRPVSRQLSALLTRTNISPNSVTTASFVVSVLAATLFSVGARSLALLAVVLMYGSLVLDCVDGELARLTDRGSRFGAWLDGFTDRIKENLLLVGLAVGSHRAGDSMWFVAALAVLVITLRHLSHFGFIDTVLEDFQPKNKQHREKLFQRPGLGALTWRQWTSRVLHAPVSERWLMIGLGVVACGHATALWLYAGYVFLSLVLVLIGWSKRTFALTGELSEAARSRVVELTGARVPKRMTQGASAWFIVPLTMLLESVSILLIFLALNEETKLWLPLAVMVAVSWLRYEDMYARSGLTSSLPSGTWISRIPLWLTACGASVAAHESAAVWWLCGCVSALVAVMLANAALTGHRLRRISQTQH